MMSLQFPIAEDARIVSLGRFSTDEQRRQSIVAQHEYCLDLRYKLFFTSRLGIAGADIPPLSAFDVLAFA